MFGAFWPAKTRVRITLRELFLSVNLVAIGLGSFRVLHSAAAPPTGELAGFFICAGGFAFGASIAIPLGRLIPGRAPSIGALALVGGCAGIAIAVCAMLAGG